MGAGGIKGCQGTPWSEELDGKELHEAAGGDLEPRESTVSCRSLTRSQPTFHHLQVWYYAAFRAVLMGTKSCTKILILPKIFPTRFRFTFYG